MYVNFAVDRASQERPASGLPAKCTRRVRQLPVPPKKRNAPLKKSAARGAKGRVGRPKKAPAGAGEAGVGGRKQREGGGHKNSNGGDSAAAVVRLSSDQGGQGGNSGKAVSKLGARAVTTITKRAGAEAGGVGRGAQKMNGVERRGAEAKIGGKQRPDEEAVAGGTHESADAGNKSGGVSCVGGNGGGDKSPNEPHGFAASANEGEEYARSRKRPRSPPNERISSGGSSSEEMPSPSSSVTASSDVRQQSLGRSSNVRPKETGRVASSRKSAPKRAKVHGVGAPGAVPAPMVVETVPKSVSRVEDADAPVLVSATDRERGVIVMTANAPEPRGGGNGIGASGGGAGKDNRENISLITTTQAATPPKHNSGSGGPGEKVVSPSSASSIIGSAKVLEKLSSPAPALTAKALSEGGDSDVARRTSSPSSSSSSCSFSSSTPSIAAEGPGTGNERSSGGSKRRRNEHSDERGVGVGAVARDSITKAGEEITSPSSPLKKKRKQDRSEQIPASSGIIGGPTSEGRTAGGYHGVSKAGRGKDTEGAGVERAGDGGGVVAWAKVIGMAPKQTGVAACSDATAADAADVAAVSAAAVGVVEPSSSSAFAICPPATPLHVHAGAIAPAAADASAAASSVQPTQTLCTVAIVSSVAAAAEQQCPQKKVQLAKFLECQRREIEQTKKTCREELAPLEAQLEALKRKLRERMKNAVEKQTREREKFCASLYGTEAVAAAAAAAVGVRAS